MDTKETHLLSIPNISGPKKHQDPEFLVQCKLRVQHNNIFGNHYACKLHDMITWQMFEIINI